MILLDRRHLLAAAAALPALLAARAARSQVDATLQRSDVIATLKDDASFGRLITALGELRGMLALRVDRGVDDYAADQGEFSRLLDTLWADRQRALMDLQAATGDAALPLNDRTIATANRIESTLVQGGLQSGSPLLQTLIRSYLIGDFLALRVVPEGLCSIYVFRLFC